jgi:short-subunit dehydrogenase
MAYDLNDRVVLITGASSGIGRACAVEFHRAGCRVAAAARSADRLETLANELGRDRLLPVKMDVTDPPARAEGLRQVRSRFGPIDVLVNNAGWASFGTVARIPQEHVQRMLALNVAAPVALVQAVLPDMLARGSGQIVNVASVVGFAPMPWMAVYSATKAALIELSAALRQELRGGGVDVIVMAPSSTRTAFFEAAGAVDARAVRLADTQYTPQRVARAMVRASRQRRREVILSAEGKTIAFLRRLSRRGADRIMREVAKRGMPRTSDGMAVLDRPPAGREPKSPQF